ncbi:6-bladed beta-propeller [Capnocytophaga canis]|uniref:6-bladed beta-propeller n=1 Tax=Capnocytophaga canis TaxID=1848903 RepID=UPI00385C4853
MKKNIFILFCLVFFSCQQSKKGTVVVWNNEGAETFVIDAVNKKSNQTTNLNDYIESCRVVPLETRRDALVNKIEKVIVANNKVYLHCDRDKILIFEANTGKFINKIHAVGQGPEEYTEITDFAIEKEQTIFVHTMNASTK